MAALPASPLFAQNAPVLVNGVVHYFYFSDEDLPIPQEEVVRALREVFHQVVHVTRISQQERALAKAPVNGRLLHRIPSMASSTGSLFSLPVKEACVTDGVHAEDGRVASRVERVLQRCLDAAHARIYKASRATLCIMGLLTVAMITSACVDTIQFNGRLDGDPVKRLVGELIDVLGILAVISMVLAIFPDDAFRLQLAVSYALLLLFLLGRIVFHNLRRIDPSWPDDERTALARARDMATLAVDTVFGAHGLWAIRHVRSRPVAFLLRHLWITFFSVLGAYNAVLVVYAAAAAALGDPALELSSTLGVAVHVVFALASLLKVVVGLVGLRPNTRPWLQARIGRAFAARGDAASLAALMGFGTARSPNGAEVLAAAESTLRLLPVGSGDPVAAAKLESEAGLYFAAQHNRRATVRRSSRRGGGMAVEPAPLPRGPSPITAPPWHAPHGHGDNALGNLDYYIVHSAADDPKARAKALARWSEELPGPATAWLDVLCADAGDDPEAAVARIVPLLASARGVVVLWGPTLLDRLLCVLELWAWHVVGADRGRDDLPPTAEPGPPRPVPALRIVPLNEADLPAIVAAVDAFHCAYAVEERDDIASVLVRATEIATMEAVNECIRGHLPLVGRRGPHSPIGAVAPAAN